MALPLQLKSLYLGLFNATMIARSLGKDLDENGLKNFKIGLFRALDHLTAKMDSGTLNVSDVTRSIARLAKRFCVSWGQAQKGINVILKSHHFLFHRDNKRLERELHCPLDSVVLEKIHAKQSLRKIQKTDYQRFQKQITEAAQGDGMGSRVEFDMHWDKQMLRRAGLL